MPCPQCFMPLNPPSQGRWFCPHCYWTKRVPDAPSNDADTPIAGLDLGQLQDYTALALVQKSPAVEGWHYTLVGLHRFDLGTAYPVVVAKVADWLTRPPWDKARLVIDQTGVGVAVVDMFRKTEVRPRIAPATITAGRKVLFEKGSWHVAKIELVSVLQALLSGRRLDIARGLEYAEDLVKELKHFKSKVTLAGNETFEAWRERDKDDMVLALALACWFGERANRRPKVF